jgi:antitoxin component of MazEF toxin-antitoxin module
MTTRIQEVAGNLTLVIPPDLASKAGVSSGSEVDVRFAAGEIIVRAISRPKKFLQEMLARATDENRHAETDWGPAVGNETW